MDSALLVVWERRSHPIFWWLVLMLAIGVALVGTRLVLQHMNQARRQRDEDERREEE